MNPSFQRLMSEATRLTQSGDLLRATAAIQDALRGAAVPVTEDDRDVIDVEAREVEARDIAAAQVGTRAVAPREPRAREVGPREAGAREVPTREPEAPRRGRGPAQPGDFITGTYTCDAGTRAYKLYVPPGYRGRPLPLIVMLHGCTQDPDDFAAGTGMNEAARERGFLVLYPAQSQRANGSRCWNWFKHNHQGRDRGEPALLAGMTRDIMDRHDVDPRRVYVAGLSAGGAMAAILGDAYPDLYAAVGVHSGLAPGSATDVSSAFAAMHGGAAPMRPGSRTPPTIVFHGDADTTVNPANGDHVVKAASAGAAMPKPERARSANGHAYTRRVYRDARGRVIAEHWLVHGSGHAWSGGSARGSHTDRRGPDATQEMLRFFFSHTLGTAG